MRFEVDGYEVEVKAKRIGRRRFCRVSAKRVVDGATETYEFKSISSEATSEED